jgi:hypothetical protein
MLGRWNGAGALEQAEVEDALYAAALANGLLADDGERQCVVQLHRHPLVFSHIVAASTASGS